MNASVLSVLSAVGYPALGFLPAVAVHSARNSEEQNFKTFWLVQLTYSLGIFAATAHFYSVAYNYFTPFVFGLRVLSFGYAGILGALFIFNFHRAKRKAIVICVSILTGEGGKVFEIFKTRQISVKIDLFENAGEKFLRLQWLATHIQIIN